MSVMKTKDAAQYLSLAPRTLEKFRLVGNGPKFSKLGRSVRYTRDALDAWLADRSVSSTSQQAAA